MKRRSRGGPPHRPQPQPQPRHAVLEVFVDDWIRLGESAPASLQLLGGGYAIAAAIGFAVRVSVGWAWTKLVNSNIIGVVI
jgi:ABC-type nitrate/sulfonate/bicarbonate transport system permease component